MSRAASLSKELRRALQLCSEIKDLVAVRQVYSLIVKHGLDSVSFFADHLIRLFTPHALLPEATYLFSRLSHKTVYTWHAIISAHTKLGDGQTALKLFHGMLLDGILPDKHVFTCCLKACHLINDIGMGMIMHVHIVNVGLDSAEAIGSALIEMYSTCGCIVEAFHVFEYSASRDIVIWDTMMFYCVQQGQGTLTLDLFISMINDGVEPSRITYICVFKACSSVGDVVYGLLVHAHIVENISMLDLKVQNTLVDFYARYGNIEDAYQVFCTLPSRDVVAWSALISGYAEHGHSHLAVHMFACMQHEGINIDSVIILSVLKACGSVEFLSVGRLVHTYILQSRMHLDAAIANTLVDMYSKCGSLQEAHNLYSQTPNPTAISSAALIAGYAEHGHGLQAIKIYESLEHTGLEPTTAIFVLTLKACKSIKALGFGREIHNEVLKRVLEADIEVGNTLIDLYAKCQGLDEACSVFRMMPNRDVVSWGAIITGCAENGSSFMALEFYEEMGKKGVSPDKVTFLASLRACACTSTICKGKHLHRQIVISGLELDSAISSSLVDMYSRCGCIGDACHVFERCPSKDIALWGSMVAGYARHGSCKQVVECLQGMQLKGLRPNDELMTSVLSMRSHESALHVCHAYCEYVFYGGCREVSIEHYSCIVYVLGRMGHLDEAEGLVQTMPISPNNVSWTGLLTGCGTFGHNCLGSRCFDQSASIRQKLQKERLSAFCVQ